MLAGHFKVDNETGYGMPELREAIAHEAARLPQTGAEDQLSLGGSPL